MILFLQHSEQRMIADRVAELGAGLKPKGKKPKTLKITVDEVLANQTYKENAQELSETFQHTGGAYEAADVILNHIKKE